MNNLTARQFLILHFIARSTSVKGFPPTFSEIAEEFGVKASTVFSHVRALIRKGFLVKDANKSRSLRIANAKVQYEIGPSPKSKHLYLWRVDGVRSTAVARFMSDQMARQFAEDIGTAARLTYTPAAAKRILEQNEAMESGK